MWYNHDRELPLVVGFPDVFGPPFFEHLDLVETLMKLLLGPLCTTSPNTRSDLTFRDHDLTIPCRKFA